MFFANSIGDVKLEQNNSIQHNGGNEFLKRLILLTLGAGLGILRYICLANVGGPLAPLAVVVTLAEPVLALMSALLLGSLLANSAYVHAIAGIGVTLIPGVAIAFMKQGVNMAVALVFALTPAVMSVILMLLVRQGTDRSTVTAAMSLTGAVAVCAMFAMAFYTVMSAADTDFNGLVAMFTETAREASEQLLDSGEFAALAKNYGVTPEEFHKNFESTYVSVFDVTFRMLVLLLPGFLYAVYSFWAYFSTRVLSYSINLKRTAPKIRDSVKKFGVGEVHITMIGKSAGYDSCFDISSATSAVFGISYAIVLLGVFIGLPTALVACASMLVIALTPTFVILGYKYVYRALLPVTKSATIPVIVVASIVLMASGITVVLVSGFGMSYVRKHNDMLKQRFRK